MSMPPYDWAGMVSGDKRRGGLGAELKEPRALTVCQMSLPHLPPFHAEVNRLRINQIGWNRGDMKMLMQLDCDYPRCEWIIGHRRLSSRRKKAPRPSTCTHSRQLLSTRGDNMDEHDNAHRAGISHTFGGMSFALCRSNGCVTP